MNNLHHVSADGSVLTIHFVCVYILIDCLFLLLLVEASFYLMFGLGVKVVIMLLLTVAIIWIW